MAGRRQAPGAIGSELMRVAQELIEALSQPPVLGALLLLTALLALRLLLQV